jgi:O-antigen/teichoic acid export membrane protein
MKNKSRTANSIRNAGVSIFSNILVIVLGFIVRTVFIRTLSTEYLGVNGLFTNILTIFSLAELGIGNAIIYQLYKPLAYQDEEKVNSLMGFYGNTYKVIALVVAGMGLLVLPFLDIIIKSPPQIVENIRIVYLLYLTNSVFTYLFIYKKSLLVADQKEYIAEVIKIIKTILLSVAQILILLIYKNFMLYLVIQMVATLIHNIVISFLVDKKYVYTSKESKKLDKEEKSIIFKDVRALFLYKISNIIINSTDNIVLSAFVGISPVGLYSNYYLIIQSVYTLTKSPLRALTASIGHLNATEDKEKQYLIYNTTNFVASWLYGMVFICFFILLDPFIVLWIGESYLLERNVVIILLINFYFLGVTGVYNIFRNTFGLFVQGQIRPLIASIINIGFSLLLVQYYSTLGVFFGTLIAYLSFSVWYDPYIVHKHAFKRSVVPFYIKTLFYLATIIIINIVVNFRKNQWESSLIY